MVAPSPADIRHANALTCVHVLRTSAGPLTISDITQRTGLSRPTVDAVIAGLEAHGVVAGATADSATTSGGRPARRFQFQADSAIVAGVDAGPRNIRVLLANLQGTVIARAERTIDGAPSASQRMDLVAETVRDACTAAGVSQGKLTALCLGVSGIMGFDNKLSHSFAVPEWNGADIAQRLGDTFNCDVVLENDIKLAAFAEHHMGAAQLVDNTLYVQIGHRISLALTRDGGIYQGAHRSAGEVGSLRGMHWTKNSVQGQLVWTSAPTAEQVFAKALAGDADALAEITHFAAEIAPRLTTVSLALDPDLIVVGGGLSQSGGLFVEILRDEIHRLIMIEGKPNVAASTLGSDGTVLGSLALAFETSSRRLFGIEGVPVPDITIATDEVTA